MLLLAALIVAFVAGWVCFVVIRDLRADAVHAAAEPMTDAQATAQVVAAAKQIVRVARLQDATGGYAFMSCKDDNDPPYQAAIYLNFRLPQSDSVSYLRDVATAMVAQGWVKAASTAENFGQKLTRDGVTVIFYRSDNRTDLATMRLYGECRNMADHRNDNPVWTEVSDQLR
jgi:hypothetical protein